MASTVTRKRPNKTPARRAPRAARIGDLSLDEFRKLMTDLIDARLSEWSDPDIGLELRPEIIASLERQEKEYAAGKRGKPLADVVKELGLE